MAHVVSEEGDLGGSEAEQHGIRQQNLPGGVDNRDDDRNRDQEKCDGGLKVVVEDLWFEQALLFDAELELTVV